MHKCSRKEKHMKTQQEKQDKEGSNSLPYLQRAPHVGTKKKNLSINEIQSQKLIHQYSNAQEIDTQNRNAMHAIANLEIGNLYGL